MVLKGDVIMFFSRWLMMHLLSLPSVLTCICEELAPFQGHISRFHHLDLHVPCLAVVRFDHFELGVGWSRVNGLVDSSRRSWTPFKVPAWAYDVTAVGVASREQPVDNVGFSNIHTKTQLSTDASREAPVDNDLF